MQHIHYTFACRLLANLAKSQAHFPIRRKSVRKSVRKSKKKPDFW
jgi:hypothetical protein